MDPDLRLLLELWQLMKAMPMGPVLAEAEVEILVVVEKIVLSCDLTFGRLGRKVFNISKDRATGRRNLL